MLSYGVMKWIGMTHLDSFENVNRVQANLNDQYVAKNQIGKRITSAKED